MAIQKFHLSDLLYIQWFLDLYLGYRDILCFILYKLYDNIYPKLYVYDELYYQQGNVPLLDSAGNPMTICKLNDKP